MSKFEHYIQVGQKKLRCGFTTGTCATAVSYGATMALLYHEFPKTVTVHTNSGIDVEVDIVSLELHDNYATCVVKKDAGDDPDITHNIFVVATVSKIPEVGINITGGKGVGIVTKAGLDQAIGEYAINSVPREMIKKALYPLLSEHDGILVELSIPEGEVLAKKTFNPRLGIEGGLSILGTSGIVRPMSQEALMESIRLEMNILRENGTEHLLLTLGNYGEDFSRDVLKLSMMHNAICSNYIGFALDCAVELGFSSVLLVGHIGKLSKVSVGNMDTHSKVSDGRKEAFCTHTALCGGSTELVTDLYYEVTSDGAIALLKKADLLSDTMISMANALEKHIKYRCGELICEALFFSNKFGVLGSTSGVEKLMEYHKV